MSFPSQVPDAGTPIFDARGYIHPVWHQFFFTLLNRTGGIEGASPVTDVTGAAPITSTGGTEPEIGITAATPIAAGSMSAVDKGKLDSVTAGAAVSAVTGSAPIASSGGTAPDISITPASTLAAGSMSAADKSKLDTITANAAVASVSGTAPIVSSGGGTPAISIVPATALVPGSMSAADKAILDAATAGGTWTVTLTCTTPGNLAITYATRIANYTKIGRMVFAQFVISTSAFTWTTASGSVLITGLPFSSAATSTITGFLDWGGITKAGFTQIGLTGAAGGSQVQLLANGSAQPRTALLIGDLPSGGTVTLVGQVIYFV